MGDAIDRLGALNQKRMEALNSGNVEEASILESQILRLKSLTDAAISAHEATTTLTAELGELQLPGSEQHQEKYDNALETLGNAQFANDVITRARASENPEQAIREDMAKLQGIAVEGGKDL